MPSALENKPEFSPSAIILNAQKENDQNDPSVFRVHGDATTVFAHSQLAPLQNYSFVQLSPLVATGRPDMLTEQDVDADLNDKHFQPIYFSKITVHAPLCLDELDLMYEVIFEVSILILL